MKIGLFSLLFLPLFTSFIPPKENNTVKAGMKMQDFVINISKYAKDFDPNFAIIPQNGLDFFGISHLKSLTQLILIYTSLFKD